MKYRKLLVPQQMKVILTEDEYDLGITHPKEVIVKSHYSHVSAGTELACLAGIESWFRIPDTPGYTAVGEIVEKGNQVDHINVGDLVYTYGPHAEYFKINTTDRWHGVCVKLPKGMNEEHAAFTHMAGIAFTAIRTATIELGDYVGVTGLGAIGNLAAQLAQLQGARVIATDLENKRLEMANNSGIFVTINAKQENLIEKIKELSEGEGVTTLIDASGISKVIEQSLEFVALNGEVILLGSPRAAYQTNLTDFLQHFHLMPYFHNLKGALEFSFPTHKNEFINHSIERNAKIIMELMIADKLKIGPVYTHKMDPADCQKAYDGLKDNKTEFIGVLFDWTK